MAVRRNFLALCLLLVLAFFRRQVLGTEADEHMYSIRETEHRVRLGLYSDPLLFDDEDESYLEGSGSGDGDISEQNSTLASAILFDFYSLTSGLNDAVEKSVDDLKAAVLPALDDFQARLENATQALASSLQCKFSKRFEESIRIMDRIYSLTSSEIENIKSQLENTSVVLIDGDDGDDGEDITTTTETPVTTILPEDAPRDCAEALSMNLPTGVTTIRPNVRKDDLKRVWCDQDTDGGGWTVLMRRQPQPVQLDFRRDWDTYVGGFGDPEEEHWIGLEAMHHITKRRPHRLRVEMQADNDTAFSLYDTFGVSSSKREYKLKINDFNESSTGGDAMEYHNGMKFTTYDMDNDGASGGNCANWSGGGGWWYNYCYFSNPTGLYALPNVTVETDVFLEWRMWRGHYNYLSHFLMMIKPDSDTD